MKRHIPKWIRMAYQDDSGLVVDIVLSIVLLVVGYIMITLLLSF